MDENPANQQRTGPSLPSRPNLSMGLMFLMLGAAYALPWRLVPTPPAHIWEGSIAPEILNLYAVTSFLGWAHFLYAWRGQWQGTLKLNTQSRVMYWLLIAVLLVCVIGIRFLLGVGLFSLLAWVYNIAHFVKGEVHFSGKKESSISFYQPVVAFTWFTLVIFGIGPFTRIPWMLFSISILLGVAMLVLGGWHLLRAGESRMPLLSLFLIGEGLVWGTYGHYMTPSFRVGVYVFHIAAAGFYHYLGSYFYARSRLIAPRKDAMLSTTAIVLINLAMLGAGCAVASVAWLHWFTPILGVEWFTLWVTMHLIASDVLPLFVRAHHATLRTA
jgi:hypothetical protein